MKKLFSLFLSLCLLLAPLGALAEGDQLSMPGSMNLTIDEIDLTLGEGTIRLDSSLALRLLYGDEGVTASLALNDADKLPILQGILQFGAEGLTGTLSGMSNSYRLSYETLQEMAAAFEEEMGMSLEDSLNQIVTRYQTVLDELTPAMENLGKVIDELGIEATEGGVEKVTVLGGEYELQRVDVTVTAEQFDRVLDAFLQILTDLQAAAPELEIEITEPEDDLQCSFDMRVWTNEDASVQRCEYDYNLTVDGETVTLPVVFEMINDPEAGLRMEASVDKTVDGETLEAALRYYDVTENGGSSKTADFRVSFTEADGETEQLLLTFGSETTASGESDRSFTLHLEADGEQYDLGASYRSQNAEGQNSLSHDGRLNLWCTMGEDAETAQRYGFGCHLNLAVDSIGADEIEKPGSIIDVEQMTDEQAEQAETELSTVLQNALLTLMNDAGIQQIVSLFTYTEPVESAA